MRKIIFSALLCIALLSTSAQTFVDEDFSSGNMPPTGWTIDQFASQWITSQSSFSGGASPEGRFAYSTATPITTRLISPVLNLTGLTSIKLSFNHFFDWYASPGPTLGVATRSSSTGTWHTAWAITPTSNIGPLQQSITISNSDVGSSEFQFCFYISGPTTMMDYWYVDNILLLNPLETNAKLVTISQTPTPFHEPAEVKGTLQNLGTDTITSVEIDWQLDGGEVFSTVFSNLILKAFDSYEFTCNDLINTSIGTHGLRVWVNAVNGLPDLYKNDDTLSKNVKKVCYTVGHTPLFEEFTSCTCIPCAFFNSDFVPWCDDHENEITLIKYQMNFPGSGDPYFIEDCSDRFTYYGGQWVPWLVGDGGFIDTEMNSVDAFFESSTSQQSLIQIQASHTIAQPNITINATVLPFANYPSCRLYIAVIEKQTVENTGPNGETNFEHVLMKMIPSASGIAVNLQERTPFTYSNTVDLSGTNIEEWDDLMVVAWVQTGFTRNVVQSTYSVEDAVLNTENRLNDILIENISLNGFSPNIYSYSYGIAQGSTEVPEITGIPMDSAEIVIVIPSQTIPGTSTIDVYAEDIQYRSQYSVNFNFNTSLDVDQTNDLAVYPNPARDYVSIFGAENSLITITDALGIQHRIYSNLSGNRISLAGLKTGIYFLKAEKPGCAAVVKKFIITE